MSRQNITKIAFSIAILFLLLWGGKLVLAQGSVTPLEAMKVANQYYEAGEFTEAAMTYESLLEAGFNESAIYYNLGNAYYREGDLGRAILNYRRAQRLVPRDAEVITNLRIARAQTVDKLEMTDQGVADNWVRLAEELLTLNEAAVLALALWLFICYFVVLSILVPRLRTVFYWVIGVLAIFLAIGIISITNRAYVEWQTPSAVVVVPEVEVTSGPGGKDLNVVEFSLHAGAEVRLVEERPGWRQISLAGGELQGWVPEETIELVIQEEQIGE